MNEKSNKCIVNNLIPQHIFLLWGNWSWSLPNSIWTLKRNAFLIILVYPHIYHCCKWSEIHSLPSSLNWKKHVTIYQFFKLFWSELCWSIIFPKKESRIKSNSQHSIQYSQHSSSCHKKITVFFFFIKALSEHKLSVTRNFHCRTLLYSLEGDRHVNIIVKIIGRQHIDQDTILFTFNIYKCCPLNITKLKKH